MMTLAKQEIDVARKIKAIEYLKAQLVGNNAQVMFQMLEGGEEEIISATADLLLTGFILARRCGIDYARLEREILDKARHAAQQRENLEKWYGDYTNFVHYLLARTGQLPEGETL